MNNEPAACASGPVRVGDRVIVRRERWQVAALRDHGTCRLVTLTGVEAGNFGVERAVLTPFDTVDHTRATARLSVASTRRWSRRLNSVLAENGPAGTLRAAQRARIQLMPHQLEPALAIVRGMGARVLIADEVGLGKTIQAGLIIGELMARGEADRVLVITPAGLREQWVGELRDKFGLAPTILGMREVRRQRASLAPGVNPWSTTGLVVTSIDYIKRPEVGPAATADRWDAVVVDEAHGASAGTDRRAGIEAVCKRAAFVVLLTATPHSGDRQAFLTLCELGAEQDQVLLFRRSRRDIAAGAGRHVHLLTVTPTPAEARMHGLLAEFARTVQRERGDGDRQAWLALTLLHKRSLSSAWSLAQSVERRLATVPEQAEPGLRQLSLPLEDDFGELSNDDLAPGWSTPVLNDWQCERRLLETIALAARRAASAESKLLALGRLLRRLDRLREPAIVFTEYRDTLVHLLRSLALEASLLHGGMSRDERQAVVEAFVSGRSRLLLATDAGGEGLNLHHRCRTVINLELPWNPMRLEQRIGRVDRIGQERRVHGFHLIAAGTGEGRLLERLRARVAAARADVPAASPFETSGEEEELIASSLVVGGPEGAALRAPDAATPAVNNGPFVLTRLEEAARVEHARLSTVRDLGRAHRRPASDFLPVGHDMLLGRVHRPTTRARLAGSVFVVLQAVAEDGWGRPIATHVTPVRVVVDRRLVIRPDIDRLLRTLPPETAAELDLNLANWRAATMSAHEGFWKIRLLRERAIAEAIEQMAPGGYQAGLFDHRSDERHRADEYERQRLLTECARRVEAAMRSAEVAWSPARPVVVLVP